MEAENCYLVTIRLLLWQLTHSSLIIHKNGWVCILIKPNSNMIITALEIFCHAWLWFCASGICTTLFIYLITNSISSIALNYMHLDLIQCSSVLFWAIIGKTSMKWNWFTVCSNWAVCHTFCKVPLSIVHAIVSHIGPVEKEALKVRENHDENNKNKK